jgi:hypothetical protein
MMNIRFLSVLAIQLLSAWHAYAGQTGETDGPLVRREWLVLIPRAESFRNA